MFPNRPSRIGYLQLTHGFSLPSGVSINLSTEQKCVGVFQTRSRLPTVVSTLSYCFALRNQIQLSSMEGYRPYYVSLYSPYSLPGKSVWNTTSFKCPSRLRTVARFRVVQFSMTAAQIRLNLNNSLGYFDFKGIDRLQLIGIDLRL